MIFFMEIGNKHTYSVFPWSVFCTWEN